MELAAQLVIQTAGIDFAHQFHHVVLKGVDAGEFHVNAHFHVTFHTMAHMHECLLLEFLGKHGDDTSFYLGENEVRIAALVACHGADDTLEHEDVLNLGDVGHQDILLAQVFNLLVAAAVAVHDAVAVQLV